MRSVDLHRWWPVVLLLAGCLRAGFEGTQPSIQDGAGPAVDQGADRAGSTSPWRTGQFTFSEPEPLVELNSPHSEQEPFVLRDGLTMIFNSGRPGGVGSTDLYTASRSALDGPFTNVQNLTTMNSAETDVRFVIAADGLTAYYLGSWTGATGKCDTFSATRTDPNVLFALAKFTPLAALNTSTQEYDLFPSTDGLRLYFVRDDLVNLEDIYLAERPDPSAAFVSVHRLADVSSEYRDANPAVTDDELVIVFNSTRPGGHGDADVWYATRSTTTDAFSAARPLPGVNTPYYEGEIYLSPDGTTLYFASDRPGGQGSTDFYCSHLVVTGP